MSDYRELVAILKELLTNRFYPKPSYIRGLLGDGNGNVLVPGRDDFNYARFNRSSSEKFEIFNKEISQPIDGWPILIGEFPWSPGLIQVVGTDWAAYSQTGWGDNVASIQAHAPTHEWPTFAPGSDAVNVYMRALTPLRTQVVGSGSNSVYVTPYEYDHTGTNVQWPGVPAMDFSSKPPTGSMLYMGVYLNPATNALGVVSGSTTVFTDALEPAIPNWPLGVYPSGYVRLYGGQAGITERDIRPAQRIYNTTLMFTGTSSGGSSGGGWPFARVLTVSTTDPDAQYTTIAAAIAAASAGDVIFLDAQTFTESITINKDITLFGPGASITSASAVTVTITSPCKLLYLNRISNSASGAEAYAVEVNAATSAVIERCTISKASGAPTIGAAVHTVDAVNLELRECIISCSAGTSRYGIYNDPNFSSITIRGGTVSGTTNSIKGTEATSLLILTNLPIISGAVAFTSTLTTGAYADSSGNVLYLDTTGTTGGVWRYRPDGLRIKEATITLADANGADGDEVHLFPGTYDLTTGLSLTKRLHFVGEGDPRSIIITGSGNFTIEPTDAGCTFRNLTILNTAGGGTDRTVIQSNVNNCVYENVIMTKTGAADDSACILQYGGTGTQIINCELTTTGATKNYAIWNNTATATIEVRGGKLSGSTWDIFGDQAGSTITLNNVVLVNDLISYTGLLLGTHLGVAVYHNAAQAIANNTITALALNSELRDDSRFHDTATNNSRLTVPATMPSWYTISGGVDFEANVTGIRQVGIMLNGATFIALNLSQAALGGLVTRVNVSTAYYLAAADYVELVVYQNSGVSLNVNSAAQFSPEFRMVRMR